MRPITLLFRDRRASAAVGVRSFAIAVLLCLAAASAGAAPEAAEHVPWLQDLAWTEVLDRAAAEEAPILIDFTASWCGPCKLLDAMVFNDSRVIAELEDAVPFRVDIDEPRYTRLKEAFDVQRLPTLVWCDADGGEIDRFTGYRPADDFLAAVAVWREGSDTFRAARRRYAAHPGNAACVLDLAERYRRRGDDPRAEVLYRRLAHLTDQDVCLTRVQGLLGLADVAGRTGRRDEGRRLARRSAELLDSCVEQQGEGLRQVVACQAALGDTAGMLETWRTLMQLDDHDIDALDGFARAALHQEKYLEEASRAALRAIVLSDHDPRIIDTLAEVYHRMGKYRRAIRWIEKSIEKDPDEEWYRQQLARFEESLRQDPWGYRGVRR